MDSYELRIAGEGRTAVVAELWHVRRNSAGGSVNTPIGYVAAAPAIADWLVRDTSATEPLLVNIFRGRNTEYVMRGRITDDD